MDQTVAALNELLGTPEHKFKRVGFDCDNNVTAIEIDHARQKIRISEVDGGFQVKVDSRGRFVRRCLVPSLPFWPRHPAERIFDRVANATP